MLAVYDCIAGAHDLRVVAVALLAAFGSHIAIDLVLHARQLAGAARLSWLLVTTITTSATVWTTHFIGIMAFRPAMAIGYDLRLAVASFVVPSLIAGFGFAVALHRGSRAYAAIGGCLVGVAIAAMHYLGMSGMHVPVTLSWPPLSVVLSVTAGCALSSAALSLALSHSRWRHCGGAALLALSICLLHFIGMSAMTVHMTAAHARPAGAISSLGLCTVVGSGCQILLLTSAATLSLSRRMAHERELERANPRDLADIAVEGLLVCRNDMIVWANASFVTMTGIAADALIGRPTRSLFEPVGEERTTPGDAADRLLIAADGEQIPVEIVRRSIAYADRPHEVLAIRDLRERRRLEQEMRFLTYTDPLTDVANQLAFRVELDRGLRDLERREEVFAVLALDLDRFDNVNDVYGPAIGDLLLKQVAKRLRSALRVTDTVARLGNDRFAILVAAPITFEDTAVIARRVLEMIRQPYMLDGKIVVIGACIGVVMAPQDGHESATLLRHAALALKQAKREGRNTLRFFEAAMDIKIRARRSMELDLQRALAEDQIKVFYQPLFDVERQQVHGFEALVRWASPERGLVTPDAFIPLAEETGLIVPIGERVLAIATRQAAAWGNGVSVAVNLSAVQFVSTDLVETVSAALAASGLPAHRLDLEITESVLLQDGTDTLSALHALRGLGVRISVDDFGTGYSSLRYLRSFPFDKIKIDRSFVAEMLDNKQSAAIIQAVLGLGQRLGITTTAEGVETIAQRDYLEQEGCNVLQGYLIGGPQPAEEAARFVWQADAPAVGAR